VSQKRFLPIAGPYRSSGSINTTYKISGMSRRIQSDRSRGLKPIFPEQKSGTFELAFEVFWVYESRWTHIWKYCNNAIVVIVSHFRCIWGGLRNFALCFANPALVVSPRRNFVAFQGNPCFRKLHYHMTIVTSAVKVQAAPSFPSSFEIPLKGQHNLCCLIPCAIDQDCCAYFAKCI